jgi:tetratricopeptide (TPR) repeat protein
MIRLLLLSACLLPFTTLAQRSAEEQLASAREAYGIDSLSIALAHADSALQQDANIDGGYKLRGDIKQRQRNFHGALLDYTRAEKQDPDDARLYVSRSAVHITEGHLREAVQDCDRAIKIDPNDADAWYNRACADYMGRNNEGARRSLERAVELKPSHADALFLRGVVRGEQYKEAAGIVDIQAALALNPDIPGGWMSLGVLQFENKEFEAAIATFTRAVEIGGDELVLAYYYLADSYYNLEDKDNACINFRRSAELGDKDAQFIVKNYCNTDAEKIPKKPYKRRNTVIEF